MRRTWEDLARKSLRIEGLQATAENGSYGFIWQSKHRLEYGMTLKEAFLYLDGLLKGWELCEEQLTPNVTNNYLVQLEDDEHTTAD